MNTVTPEEVGLSSARLEDLRAAAQGFVDEGKLAGLITMVARRGKVAHLECYGMMDIEAKKPMRTDTIFRIYSMTKPVTCVAFMMLVEEGRVRLSDPVSRYIPEFDDLKVFAGNADSEIELANLEREITIWHLLTHTSGMAYGVNATDTPVEDMYRAAGLFDATWQLGQSLHETVQTLVKLPLAHQPGMDWRYSMAHDVIAYLVGIISGVPVDAFLAERIFGRLGMRDTGFYVPTEKLDRLAALYSSPSEGGISLLDAPASSPLSRPGKHPAGGNGIVSTVSDYARLAQMLLNGGELDGVRLLRRETVQEMTTNQLPDDLVPIHFGPDPWPGMGYGYGLGVVVDPAALGTPWSKGTFQWLGIGGTAFWADPGEELIVLIMPQALFYFEPLDTLVSLARQAIAQ